MAKKPQIEKFREKARELGVDESEDKFDEALRRLANNPSDPQVINDLAEMLGQTDPNKDFSKDD